MSEDKPTTKESVKQVASPSVSYYEAVGRRKNATARVRLYVAKENDVTIGGVVVAKGDMVVNGRPAETYFAGEVLKKIYLEPFRTTNTIGRFAVSVLVTGGGLAGQLGATLQGIARALEKTDKENSAQF